MRSSDPVAGQSSKKLKDICCREWRSPRLLQQEKIKCALRVWRWTLGPSACFLYTRGLQDASCVYNPAAFLSLMAGFRRTYKLHGKCTSKSKRMDDRLPSKLEVIVKNIWTRVALSEAIQQEVERNAQPRAFASSRSFIWQPTRAHTALSLIFARSTANASRRAAW